MQREGKCFIASKYKELLIWQRMYSCANLSYKCANTCKENKIYLLLSLPWANET